MTLLILLNLSPISRKLCSGRLISRRSKILELPLASPRPYGTNRIRSRHWTCEVLDEFYQSPCHAGITFLDERGTRERISYAELGHRVRRAAAFLQVHGVQPESLVAMTLANDLASVLAMLGTWAAGATVVSVPPSGKRSSEVYTSRFGAVLDAMGCEYMVTDDPAGPAGPLVARISKTALLEPGGVRYAEVPPISAPERALIQFSSGSVAEPKGVVVSSAALTGHLKMLATAFDYGRDGDRIVSWLPLYHDMGLLVVTLAGMVAQVEQLLATPRFFVMHPANWMTLVSQEKATITGAPDFAFRIASRIRYGDDLDLSRVRLCLDGGERVDWQSLADFHDALGRFGLRWESLAPCYGLAEATVGVSMTPLDRGPLRGPMGHTSSGHPFPGVTIHQQDGPVPGSIRLSSPWLFDGYYTRSGYSERPEAIFDTGDAGFRVGDELFVLGRFAEMITVAGRNIFAEDVEAIAYEAGGRNIRGCAAFRNGDRSRFGLLMEADPEMSGTPKELGQHVRSNVADALGVRLAQTVVTARRTIPRTTSGKVQRARARDLYESGTLEPHILAVIR